MVHGLASTYSNHGCRCDECRTAKREYDLDYVRRKRALSLRKVEVDRGLLGDLLDELFPYGLTDDCPAARSRRSVVV
jgi:hypothetical protein